MLVRALKKGGFMVRRQWVIKCALILAGVVGMVQADMLHTTTQWQSLGVETIADGAATNSLNGVMWKIGDAGEFGNSDFDFEVGDKVTFKVTLYKEYQGTHLFDALKVWMNDDVELQDALYLKDNGNVYSNGMFSTSFFDNQPVHSSYDYTFDYTFASEGDYDLTARVTCSDDLADVVNNFDNGKKYVPNYLIHTPSAWAWKNTVDLVTNSDWAGFTRTNSMIRNGFGQGETERYKFTVTSHSVPEPSLISLLGFGLLGLTFVTRKRR